MEKSYLQATIPNPAETNSVLISMNRFGFYRCPGAYLPCGCGDISCSSVCMDMMYDYFVMNFFSGEYKISINHDHCSLVITAIKE